MSQKINVLVVDDHPFMRNAITSIVKILPYVENVYEAENGLLCIKHLSNVPVEAVLLDISMPHMNGIECIRQIKRDWPKVKVIVLTQFADTKYFRTMMGLGASGYLLKSTTESEFIKSFEDILFNNQVVVDEQIEGDLNVYDNEGGEKVLGSRESEILSLVCQGLRSHEIAGRLNISLHTVNNHRKMIIKKTGANTTAGLVQWAKDHGIT